MESSFLQVRRWITEAHCARMAHCKQFQDEIPESKGAECIIAEMDGGMIPVVEIAKAAEEDTSLDRRKYRELCWKEVRLALAHAQGSVSPVYGTIFGGPDEAGDLLLDCTIRAGLGVNSRVHCVGDEAQLIADQVSQVFSAQADYLLDFYYVCENLASAAGVCAPGNKVEWLEEQKKNPKEDRISEVIEALQQPFEQGSDDAESPARKCYEYLTKRKTQLEYKKAVDADPPLGSGEVESGHRYIIQDRFKLPGAWWKKQNAQSMVALRVRRANGGWDSYWASERKQAA